VPESTFATASLEEQWRAFFNAVNLFRRLAKIVADQLGYEYPMQLDKEMSTYYSLIRNTYRETANIMFCRDRTKNPTAR